MAVSPFDGVNRIRFKGSPEEFRIAECEFRILKRAFDFNSQFAIPISQFFPGLSALIFCRSGLPRNVFDFQTVERILGPFRVSCNWYVTNQSDKGAKCNSLGQRPRNETRYVNQALKARDKAQAHVLLNGLIVQFRAFSA